MATAEQIKSLIRAYSEQDNDKFKTVVLQIAAYEAKIGHTALARELKSELEKTRISKSKILQFGTGNQMLLMVTPSLKMRDLIVPDDLHDRIERILKEFVDRHKLQKFGMSNRRKILLEGLPGTGKTMTASVIASELALPLFVVQMDKLVTKFMGETSVKLRQIFDSIETIFGVYLFDEFDAIGADRGMDNEVGEMRRILNSFLQFLEQDVSESIVIASTNNSRILDKALFRRFDDVLHYDLPSASEIERLFAYKLGAFDSNFKPSVCLLDKSNSLSHAEISRICEDAIKEAILTDKANISEETLLSLLEERLTVYGKGVV
jgi:AAA+ superfamily predicted ATPase